MTTFKMNDLKILEWFINSQNCTICIIHFLVVKIDFLIFINTANYKY